MVRGIGNLTDKTDSLLPGGIGGQARGVVEREDLAASMECLRKAKNIADGKRTGAGIVLKIVFSRKAVFGAEHIVDIAVYLVCIEGTGRSGL